MNKQVESRALLNNIFGKLLITENRERLERHRLMTSNSNQPLSKRVKLPTCNMTSVEEALNPGSQKGLRDAKALQKQQKEEMIAAVDPLVAKLIAKPGQHFVEGEFKEPVFASVGSTGDWTQNYYDPVFWFQDYCFQTNSMRVRRSVYEVPRSSKIVHYINILVDHKDKATDKIRFQAMELDSLIKILNAIKIEIEAYPVITDNSVESSN